MSMSLSIDVLIIMIMLVIYIVVGGYMEVKKVPFGHETGLAIILGIAISATLYFTGVNKYDFLFNGDLFFFFVLPPIIFASGFNMRRKKFFANMGYIALFGLLGTLVTFFIFSGLTYGLFKTGLMKKYDPVTK